MPKIKVEPPKQVETTIKHIPTFEKYTPTEESIKQFEEQNLQKFEKVVKDRNERMCGITCPCCGKVMMIERNALLLKIGSEY